MINKASILAALLALAGCAGTPHIQPTITKPMVIMPESAYFTCDVVKLPDPKNLTDVQVAQLINDLVKANKICSNNMQAIKQYLETAKRELESKKTEKSDQALQTSRSQSK